MTPIQLPKSRILLAKLRNNCKVFSRSHYSTVPETKSVTVQRQVNVLEMDIDVTISGNGPHVVLCMPGMLGTAETDFRPILDQMDETKFTTISWDPPGYGKSRPPTRCQYLESFDNNESSFHLDARVAGLLMTNLGFESFSIMGFSGGGLSSVVFAASFPQRVSKLCFWSSMARFSKKIATSVQYMNSKEMWPEDRWEKMSMMYNREEMEEMCSKMADQVRQLSLQDFKMDELAKDVAARTLILNGKQDPLVSEDQARLYNKAISNSILECWPDAGHDLHLQFPDRFVKRVQDFLLS